MPIVFAYWKIRGLAQPIRLLLNYVDADFEDKMYECGDAPDYNKDSWLNEKFNLGLDFPNLPYLIDGDIKITQTNAILSHLARKYKLDGKTLAEKATSDMMLNVVMDFRNDFVRLCYGKFEEQKNDYIERARTRIESFEKFLGDKKFFAGDEITVCDFHMYEMIDQNLILEPTLLDKAPKLKAYMKRFEEIPQIKKYMASDKFMKGPLNNKMARFGNK